MTATKGIFLKEVPPGGKETSRKMEPARNCKDTEKETKKRIQDKMSERLRETAVDSFLFLGILFIVDSLLLPGHRNNEIVGGLQIYCLS